MFNMKEIRMDADVPNEKYVQPIGERKRKKKLWKNPGQKNDDTCMGKGRTNKQISAKHVEHAKILFSCLSNVIERLLMLQQACE